jgi:hypothetical protein
MGLNALWNDLSGHYRVPTDLGGEKPEWVNRRHNSTGERLDRALTLALGAGCRGADCRGADE